MGIFCIVDRKIDYSCSANREQVKYVFLFPKDIDWPMLGSNWSILSGHNLV
jgi:hypothetical protein